MLERRALVTGATGGFGRCLIPALLAAGYSVRGTGRNAEVGQLLTASGVEFVQADLVHSELRGLIQDCDTVFHLAALSSPWGKPQTFQDVNVKMTKRLLETSRTHGVGSFIYASTPSIYSSGSDRFDIDEGDLHATPFANDYAATKFKSEQLVRAANVDGFNTVSLRPRAIISQYDSVLLPRVLRAARSGRMPLPNNGRAHIDVTDARDVAKAFILADHNAKNVGGDVFNISGGQSRQLKYILDLVFDHMGETVRYVQLPAKPLIVVAGVMETIARLLPGNPEPPATKYSIKALAYSQTFNISKAKIGLGWAPQYSPEVAIKTALDGMAIHA